MSATLTRILTTRLGWAERKLMRTLFVQVSGAWHDIYHGHLFPTQVNNLILGCLELFWLNQLSDHRNNSDDLESKLALGTMISCKQMKDLQLLKPFLKSSRTSVPMLKMTGRLSSI